MANEEVCVFLPVAVALCACSESNVLRVCAKWKCRGCGKGMHGPGQIVPGGCEYHGCGSDN